MEKKHILFVGLFAFFVIGIVVFISWTDKPAPSNVTVSFTPPKETPTPINYNQNKSSAPELVSAKSKLSSASSEIIDQSQTLSASSQENNFTLHMQDAMGEPVASGIVSAGSTEYKFTKGELLLPGPFLSVISVSVSAEGYNPVTATLLPKPGEQQILIMEYTSSFELYVCGKDRQTPEPGVTIRIWKAKSPARPLLQEYPVFFPVKGGIIIPARASLEQGEFRIHHNSKLLSPTFGVDFDPVGYGQPKSGDIITSLGNCSWNNRTNPLFE